MKARNVWIQPVPPTKTIEPDRRLRIASREVAVKVTDKDYRCGPPGVWMENERRLV